MFFELRVAKAWRLNPQQWRAALVDDRALMMSYEMFCDTREAYRQEWREARRENKDKEKRGVNPYQVLKSGMGL